MQLLLEGFQMWIEKGGWARKEETFDDESFDDIHRIQPWTTAPRHSCRDAFLEIPDACDGLSDAPYDAWGRPHLSGKASDAGLPARTFIRTGLDKERHLFTVLRELQGERSVEIQHPHHVPGQQRQALSHAQHEEEAFSLLCWGHGAAGFSLDLPFYVVCKLQIVIIADHQAPLLHSINALSAVTIFILWERRSGVFGGHRVCPVHSCIRYPECHMVPICVPCTKHGGIFQGKVDFRFFKDFASDPLLLQHLDHCSLR